MIEKIEKNNELIAIIIKGHPEEKLNFVTPDEFPIQLGFHNREKGEEIQPHLHKNIPELKDIPAHEMFHIKEGKVEIGLFDSRKELVKKVIVEKGDTIFLTAGHSFKFLEDTKMFEVKQGPYRDKEDKEYF